MTKYRIKKGVAILLSSFYLYFLYAGLYCANINSNQEDGIAWLLLQNIYQNSTALGSAGCPSSNWNEKFPSIYLANMVTEAPGETGVGFKDSTKAINGICGGGNSSGSLDVYSLQSSLSTTYCVSNEKCIALEWKNQRVKNISGIDFIVFENPFYITSDGFSRFMEPVIVEVSDDGTNWCGWNPQYIGPDTTDTNLRKPSNWIRFAGITPVKFHQEKWEYTEQDVWNLSLSGGDGFDLDDSNFGLSGSGCSSSIVSQIRTNGFVYIRLISANSRGFSYSSDSFDQTADIDGVIAKTVVSR